MSSKKSTQKKLFLICPSNLRHCLFILHPTINPVVGKYVVVSNPTLHVEDPPNPLPPNMNFIIWNCRGSQSPDFCRNFRYLLDYYYPTLVVLIETHLSDHMTLRDDFQFTNMEQVPAEGNSGGIVVL